MKTFRFGLQRVLNYRETVEDALMTELAAITHEYELETGRLHHLRRSLNAFRDGMKEKLDQGDPEAIRQSQNYLQVLLERVERQRLVVEQVGRRKEEKTCEVVEASKDRQVLDRLREIKAGEHRVEILADEQKFLDDLAGMRHRAKGGGPG